MTEINEAGYERLRQAINSSLTQPGQWDYLALLDDQGGEETRVEISTDDRATWTTTETDQVQTVEVTISGGDSDITPPVTLAESELHNSESSSEALHADSFTTVTLEGDSDQLTVIHEIESPEVEG